MKTFIKPSVVDVLMGLNRVSMFKDGLGNPIRLGDTIYINGHEMIVRYGKHVNDSTNWLFGANHNSREMCGWYAESPCGSWEVNLYSKKDQIVSMSEKIALGIDKAVKDMTRRI